MSVSTTHNLNTPQIKPLNLALANTTATVSSRHERQDERLRTHSLAELKKYKWLPFFSTYSGVILDISVNGVKLAFSGEVDVKPHTIYTLRIPLIPLGITHVKYFESALEVKWFDSHKYRLGGLFINLSHSQQQILRQIITSLQATKTQP